MEDETFSIQLKIADRHFTYTCKRKDEQNVRKAASNVTEKYIKYSSYYAGAGYSMIDLLEMVALHFSMEARENVQREDLTPFIDKIEQLNAELERYIQTL
jgi:cell division protein ZapA